MVHTVFKRVWYAKTECESYHYCSLRTKEVGPRKEILPNWEMSAETRLHFQITFSLPSTSCLLKLTIYRTYTKHGPQVHGPPLWTRTMDHLFALGPWTPSWTTPHFKRQRTQNGRRWVSECLSSQSFGFAGGRVIDLKCIYFSNAGICGADLPDSSDR